MGSAFACAPAPAARSSVRVAARVAPSSRPSFTTYGVTVLSKPNRVVRAEDFRATMRKGRRVATEHAIFYLTARAGSEPARFGFVISKAVGGSVDRNRLRRRLRAIAHSEVSAGFTGRDIVVRVLPGSASLSWTTLQQEMVDGIRKGTGQ